MNLTIRIPAKARRPNTQKDPPISWAASQTGPREQNEDDYGRADQDTSNYDWINRGCVYVLADGMGGLDGGKQAAQLAVRGVISAYRNSAGRSQDVRQNLAESLQNVNEHIYRAATLNGRRSGSTVVACVLKDGMATIAHAGDSRAYQLANGSLRRCTKDHLFLTEHGDVHNDDEAKRSPEGNKITRALGKDSDLQVDINEVPYAASDRFLLCSDGISEVLSPEEIRACLLQQTPEKAVRALGALAERRLRDNATAVVVFASGNGIRRRKTFLTAGLYTAAFVLVCGAAAGGYFGWRWWQSRPEQTAAKSGTATTPPPPAIQGTPTPGTGDAAQRGDTQNSTADSGPRPTQRREPGKPTPVTKPSAGSKPSEAAAPLAVGQPIAQDVTTHMQQATTIPPAVVAAPPTPAPSTNPPPVVATGTPAPKPQSSPPPTPVPAAQAQSPAGQPSTAGGGKPTASVQKSPTPGGPSLVGQTSTAGVTKQPLDAKSAAPPATPVATRELQVTNRTKRDVEVSDRGKTFKWKIKPGETQPFFLPVTSFPAEISWKYTGRFRDPHTIKVGPQGEVVIEDATAKTPPQ